MRLLVLTSSYPQRPGDWRGAFVRELSLALMEQDIDVRVAAPRPDPADVIETDPAGPDVVWLPSVLPATTKAFFGSGLETNLLAHPGWALGLPKFLTAFSIEAALQAWQVDGIVAHWLLPMGFVGATIARVVKRPLIVVDHSGPPTVAWIPPMRQMARFAVASAGAVVCVSDEVRMRTASFVGSELAQRLVTRPMGIDLRPTAAPPKTSHQVRILFVGRLVSMKGVDVLIRALQGMDKMALMIIGDGPEASSMRTLAAKLDVHVTFAGEQDRETTRAAMQRHDVLIIPSKNGFLGRREGLPRVMQEAWACGLPVIASKTGGLSEAIQQHGGGMLVVTGNVRSLRDALNDFSRDAMLRERLRREAMEAARSYSWQALGPSWAALIRDVVAGRPLRDSA